MTRLIGFVLFLLVLAPISLAADVLWTEGIEFTNPDDQHLKLNMARPADDGTKRPAILCIHGGGFRAGTRDGYNALCKKLAAEGFVAVTVSYRLAPKYPFPAALHDVKAAVRFLRAHAEEYGIDPDRIGAMGGSAGANLAMMLGVTAGVKELEGDGGNAEQSSAVACVVEHYGPTDFTQSYGKSVDAAEVLPLYLGGNAEQEHRRHILASPLYWVTPLAAPMLIIHGTEDSYVAYEQAEWIYERMLAADVDVQLLKMQGAGHGFKGEDATKADDAMIRFFKEHLATAQESKSTGT